MQIIETPLQMQQLSRSWCCGSHEIGLLPTMGALHAGHLALARRARAENERFVASIFVNPTQFGSHEDLSRYPRPFERDCALLQEAGCDAVFAPSPAAMYGSGEHTAHETHTIVEVARLGDIWEGVTRPGHLRGVATVCAKLFNIVSPQRAYFGEKDYQQLRVIEQMVHDLNFPLQIVPCATVREDDGLALSSRNAYLSEDERPRASVLFRAMQCGIERAQNGERDVRRLGEAMEEVLRSEPEVAVQYLTVVDARTLEPLVELDGRPARILIAARVGQTRLIDNVAIS